MKHIIIKSCSDCQWYYNAVYINGEDVWLDEDEKCHKNHLEKIVPDENANVPSWCPLEDCNK